MLVPQWKMISPSGCFIRQTFFFFFFTSSKKSSLAFRLTFAFKCCNHLLFCLLDRTSLQETSVNVKLINDLVLLQIQISAHMGLPQTHICTMPSLGLLWVSIILSHGAPSTKRMLHGGMRETLNHINLGSNPGSTIQLYDLV